jgi:hypothetical protein
MKGEGNRPPPLIPLSEYDEIQITITPRAQAALDELQAMIATRFPEATFEVQTGLDPAGIYLLATVDIEDTDGVFAVVVDRLIDMQVCERLPIYVVPLQPLPRVIAEMRKQGRLVPPLLPTG